jgi:hypothetical protein
MADVFSILSSSYSSASLNSPNKAVYKNVDPDAYKGTWSGTFNNGQKFEFLISDVNGFRARVRFKSGGTTAFQQVLISNDSFRVGDSKFQLSSKPGLAMAKSVVTDAATGSTTLLQGYAQQG